MYYVYSGVFSDESNAIKYSFDLFWKGYDVVCNKFDESFWLQVGAFENKENAEHFRDVLKADGFDSFIGISTEDNVKWELTYLTQS